MPNAILHSAKSSLAYAKLSATPTETAWSQVYNAGNLFACLSLTGEKSELHELQTLGKDFFSNLEAEFFTLEDKTLPTIGEAIHKSAKDMPEGVTAHLCLAYFKDDTLYLFVQGQGRIVMKRGEKIGVLLTGNSEENKLVTASGFLQNGDTVVLETDQFAKNISDKHLTDALQLNLPNDIAEALSLQMHKHAQGDQAAIIIAYHGVVQHVAEASASEENLKEAIAEDRQEEEEIVERETPRQPVSQRFRSLFSGLRIPSFPRPTFGQGLSHRRKLFLSVTVVILVLLLVSIFLTKQKQQTSQDEQLFKAIYTPANQSYEEGKSLENLNKTLSREDMEKARALLKDGLTKFPKGSNEANQLQDLLSKVDQEIGPETTSTTNTAIKEASVSDNDLLALEKANADAKGFSQDENVVYFVTDKAAFSVDKKSGKKTELVKNDGDWNKAVSIVPYQTNFYILDQKEGILKYIASKEGYDKATYLKQSTDLSKAVSMAIDSSVWILFSDGSIKKYTKGEPDLFTVKGLKTPFKNPTKIFTDKDITNIYILDRGNSRVVKLGQDGAFQQEYAAGSVKDATDFEVNEKDKQLLLLIKDKIYQIDL